MIQKLFTAGIMLISSSVFAHEFKFDLGFIEAPACYTTQWSRSNSIQAPVPQNKYGVRVTHLIATVITNSEVERNIKIIKYCGEAARRELSEVRSIPNIRAFSQLFEEYMQSCTESNAKTLQIYKAFVDYEEKCTPQQ